MNEKITRLIFAANAHLVTVITMPRTVMAVRMCCTVRTSSSYTVSAMSTARTEPEKKATFLARTASSGDVKEFMYLDVGL